MKAIMINIKYQKKEEMRKKKLLEYIVYQTVRGRKAYINDILK